jgi:hypothetical protein
MSFAPAGFSALPSLFWTVPSHMLLKRPGKAHRVLDHKLAIDPKIEGDRFHSHSSEHRLIPVSRNSHSKLSESRSRL